MLVPVDEKVLAIVQSTLRQPVVTPEDTHKIIDYLEATPTLLNHLSLSEVSKLSTLGIDLSRYMSAVHINNIKVFVVKFASESMSRISRLIDILNKVEDKYYNLALTNQRLHPDLASDMIDKIQESITSSVNLMMKLTDNETLMNLFIVNMTTINESITENREKGYTDTKDILPLESRKKIDSVVSVLSKLLSEKEEDNQASDVVDAEYTEKE